MLLAASLTMVAQSRQGFDLNERGLQAWQRGDLAAAEGLYREALTVWRAQGPGYEAHAATTLMNLGQTLSREGKWSDAGKTFDEALVLNRRSLGPRHIRTVTNLNLLANASMVLGDSQRAEALYSEALQIERELYPNHIALADTLSGLGSLRARAGNSREGLPLAEEALSVTLQVEGENGPDAATMYGNVAAMHRFAGRPERAIPLVRKAIAICERTGGSGQPRFASLLSEEGLALMEDGDLGLAEQDMLRATRLLAKCDGCGYQLALAENNLGVLRLRQRKYAQADAVLTHALSLERQVSARPGFEMADTLRLLSEVRQKERKPKEAARLKSLADQVQLYH